MVCTASDLLGWRDFPKGLKVLLLDEDSNSAAEIRSKLEEMEYIVSTFCNENEALSAISNKHESFHVAIVEVSTGNSNGRFKFLESTKDLPTIMTSNMQCLSTMMKCIALGAVEFLLKPLSDEKLRNIWQHVVHKAFNAGGQDLSDSLKPIKESVVSMLHLKLENGESKSDISEESEHVSPNPTIKARSKVMDDGDCQDQTMDDGDCQDHTNCSAEKECGDQDGESKSVENTYNALAAESTLPQILENNDIKADDEATDGCKGESNKCSSPQNKNGPSDLGDDAGIPCKASGIQNPCGNKANRKKMKQLDWTPELHKKFIQAVEQLGVDQAIPSRILELMKVEGLTRHNVASHLQKYRMQRRHILPKEDDRRWPHIRDASQRSYYPHKPVMAYPPYHSNPAMPAGQIYPAWGSPGSYPSSVQLWGPHFYPPWQPTESWHWRPYPGMHADAWGCPVMPQPAQGICPSFPQHSNGFQGATNTMHNGYVVPQKFLDLHPAEEVIDKVVKEAISKPWLPLPIGLKPPSTDSVLSELSRQGISTIPPYINGTRPR
ncbi:hypothetical protein NMG60_11027500 [Bertholletia excelsa]